MIETIDYTKKLNAACACGRPATIAGQCNGCHEIGQYVSQTAHANRKTVNLDEALAQQSADEAARIAKALDFSELHEAIDNVLALCRRAEIDRDNEALLRAARGAGFPNARIVSE